MRSILTALVILMVASAWTLSSPAPSVEKDLIFKNSASASATSRPATEAGSSDLGFVRLGLALAVVIGLVFFLRWSGRRLFPSAMSQGSTRAVQVLGRSMVSPKQSVLLLQVGKRVVVVADTGTQMSALCQITDEDEIASLIGQVRQEKNDSITRTFGRMFGKAREQFDQPPTRAKSEAGGNGADEQPPDGDTALVATQQELDGLQKTVRSLSRQFGRS